LDRPDVSVVIVNYNGRRWIDDCLTAVLSQQDVQPEVIFVDNASTDGSVEYVGERFPAVRIVALQENTGFAGGNNAGARAARGRLLAFLNNDTVADGRWLASLRLALDANPDAGLATSRIVYMHDPETVDSAGDAYTRAGGAFKRGHGAMASAYLEPCEVFGACGAAFMIRRKLFEELGGFDEDFFLVYEDVDLSYRAQLRGQRVLYVPGAIVRHAGSASMGTVSRTSVFHGQRNLEWVYVKNTPAPMLLRTLPAHVIYSLAGAAYLATAGRLWTWTTAKWAALRGLPAMFRKRRAVQRTRARDTTRLWGLMERRWLGQKWREKRFDLGARSDRRP
jgi:GT2 family glycosyltransferase